jgi:Protein of unknown function (DUF4232)
MRGMSHRLFATIGLGLGLGLAVTACNSSGHTAATGSTTATTAADAAPTTAAPTTVTGVTPTTSASSTPATSTVATTPAGPGECATSSLQGSLTGSSGTAGSIYYQLVLTNTGSATCVVEGYPGVSFVYGSQGQQVGAAAARTPGNVVAVTLTPGASAQATLQITEASNYGNCGLTSTDGLRVYPPDQLTALLINHDDQACSDTNDVTLHVGPLQ